MLDDRAIQIIKKRCTGMTVPAYVRRYFAAKDKDAALQGLSCDQLSRLLIWFMPGATDHMSQLDRYYRSLVRGPDAYLSQANHLGEAQAMYRVCRAIVNERRGAKW